MLRGCEIHFTMILRNGLWRRLYRTVMTVMKQEDAMQSIPHQTVIWDNLYCNDYCPRRLFVGEYTHRPVDIPVLLNGTGGLIQTGCCWGCMRA